MQIETVNSDREFLIKFFKNEAIVGRDLGWPDYQNVCEVCTKHLELDPNIDLEVFATYFKLTAFEEKEVLLETLEQDWERPDLSVLLGHTLCI